MTMRPLSIKELSDEAAALPFLSTQYSATAYARSVQTLNKQASVLEAEGDIETAFIALVKGAKIAIDFLPTKHPQYRSLDETKRKQLQEQAHEILSRLSRLKPILSDRYEAWLAAHPDGLELERKETLRKHEEAVRKRARLQKRPPGPEPLQDWQVVDQGRAYDGLPPPPGPNVSQLLSPGLPYLRSNVDAFDTKQYTSPSVPVPVPTRDLYETPTRPFSRLDLAHQSRQGFSPSPGSRISYPAIIKQTAYEPLAVISDLDQRSSSRLRNVLIPDQLVDTFVALAMDNTERRIETCGLLLGKLLRGEYQITTLLLPKQKGSNDTCEMLSEEDVFDYQDPRDLLTLGWIHSHPQQTCFLSSVDLHTQLGFQISLPEAIAVVCAPSQENAIGIFRLTTPEGVQTIADCQLRGFHPHPPLALYTDANAKNGHVRNVRMPYDTVDFR